MREGISGWLIYLRLQGKRVFRLLPAILLIGALFLGTVLLVGRSFFLSDASGAEKKAVRLGVVGSLDDPMLSTAVATLQNLDTSRFAITLETMSEEEAASALRRGELQAYILIPDGFYDAVNYYRNDVQITYVSTAGAVGIGTVMINEIAEAVGALLLESENAVYGMQSYASERFGDRFTDGEIGDLGFRMSLRYASAIFRRESMYEVHETGLTNSLTFRGYYVCALLLLFLLLIAVPFSPLHTDRDDSLFRLLRVRGISCFAQVMAEYLAFAVTVVLLTVPVLFLSGALLQTAGFSIPEFSASPISSMLSLFPACIPAVFTVCAMQFLLYELFTGAVSGILVQVLAALTAAYISGCFYPISYFPKTMQFLSDLLPAGTARLLVENGLLGSFDAAVFARALLWIPVCLALAALARRLSGGQEKRRAAA